MIQYLNVHGISIKLFSYTEEIINKLKHDYGLFYTSEEDNIDIEVIVEKAKDNYLGREYFVSLKGNYCFVSREKIHFYIVNENDAKFYTGEFRKYFTAVISRKLYEKYKALCFHSASVEMNGKGIVFMGESGSGKTSLALQFFLSKAKYVSNELTFMYKDKEVNILGMPQQINLGKGALAWFYKKSPELIGENYNEKYKNCNAKELFEKGNLDKISIDIAQKKLISLSSVCKYIIFPNPNVGAKEPIIELLSPETFATKLLSYIIPPTKYGFQSINDSKEYYDTVVELVNKIVTNAKGFEYYWTENHDTNEYFLKKFMNV